MARSSSLPFWVAAASAILWGVWWIPVRALEASGLTGVWAGIAMNAGALPLLVLIYLLGPRAAKVDLRAIASGVLVGGAMIFYSAAITETTVVRAILLFYLAPAWAISIECLFMGRKFTRLNALSFLLTAIGILFVFRGEVSFSSWNSGDLLALFAGVSWAVGTVLVFTGPEVSARTLSLFGCAGGIALGLGIVLVSGLSLPSPADVATTSFNAIASGCAYLAPVLIATLWSARRLSPTTLSFLLTGEIISAVATSAWFLSEPFGWPEALGSTLIVTAALLEVVSPKSAATT